DELIDRPRVGARRFRDLHGLIVNVRPVGGSQGLSRVGLIPTVRERCFCLVQGRSPIGQLAGGRARGITNPLFPSCSYDRLTIVRGDGQLREHQRELGGGTHRSTAGEPAAPYGRVTVL